MRSAATVAPGGMLETEFADGVVTSRITGGNDE